MKTSRFPSHTGFTLVEILIALAVIAVISSTSYVVIQGAAETDRVRTSVLANDVNTLNSAVQLYLANGGEIPANLSAEQVLERLKSRASEESAASSIGLTGSFVDPRIVIEPQTAAEGASNRARALWNSAARRFVISEGGPQGIKEFRLSDAAGVAEYAADERNTSLRAATETQWIWDYEDTPATVSLPGSNPNPVLGADPDPFPTRNTNQLAPPTYSEAPGSLALANFDLNVTIQNPNPSGASQLYFSLNGSPYLLYGGQTLTVTPDTTINSFAVSIDPDRWTDSDIAPALYEANPVTLSVTINNPSGSLTFAQAGGAMFGMPVETPPPATVNITNLGEIPIPYQNSANFEIVYTTDGSDPLVSGSAVVGEPFSGGYLSPFIARNLGVWGESTSLTIRAAARAVNNSIFESSEVASATISIATSQLPPPVIDPPGGLFALQQEVTISPDASMPVPEEFRIFYTVDGTDPGVIGGNPANGLPYNGSFAPPSPVGSETVITARVYGPEGYAHWFTPSLPVSVAFTSGGADAPPSGALVAFSALYGNAQFVGNLMIASPPAGQTISNVFFYSDTRIRGNLYLPAQPELYVNWVGPSQRWTPGNDQLFAPHIAGRHYLEDGSEVVPAQETPFPRVKEYEPPSDDTRTYNVIFYGNSRIEGKVYRRYGKSQLPTVPPPGNKSNNNTVSYSNWDFNPSNPNPAPSVVNPNQFANVNLNTPLAHIPLLPGNYGSVAASSNSKVILGDPNNPDVVQEYSFESLSLTGGADLEVVGRVIVTVRNSIAIHNGAVMGNPENPDWLQLNFYSTNTPTQWNVPQQFHSTGTSQFYGRIVAPNGMVKFDGTSVFQGSVSAYKLEITSNSVIFLLPPVLDP